MNITRQITLRTQHSDGIIKALNGGNLAPPIVNEKAGWNIRSSFRELNIPLTRLHDAPLENAGTRLVDIPLIFANFHADENDPRNYYFRQTDDYIRNCLEGGTGIIYRLGTSIEHGTNKYFIDPPEDVDKWISICDRIIRHYTEGWADGFHFNIRYWEIWNEPEVGDADGVHLMWNGTLDEFNRFYVRTATELKKRFPHLLFGGPAHCGFREYSKDFIAFCAEHHAPLDFYSYHCYDRDPQGWIVQSPHEARKALDMHGYTNTEIHLNEWHYFPGEWIRLREDCNYRDRIHQEMRGLDSAAFTCSVMNAWQDTPLNLGCLYTVTTTNWGIYQKGSNVPTKLYYGMKAYGDIIRYPERMEVRVDGDGVTALAGRDASGACALLISCFKTGAGTLFIDSDCDLQHAELLALDENHNLDKIPPDFSEGRLRLTQTSDSAVFLLHF